MCFTDFGPIKKGKPVLLWSYLVDSQGGDVVVTSVEEVKECQRDQRCRKQQQTNKEALVRPVTFAGIATSAKQKKKFNHKCSWCLDLLRFAIILKFLPNYFTKTQR